MLIVIDMQDGFLAAHCRKAQIAVMRQIRLAKIRRQPIIIMEFTDRGGTFDFILSEAKGTDHAKVSKAIDDGSAAVKSVVKRKTWKMPKEVRVCGVNLSCCVLQTTIGLADTFPETTFAIVVDATNDSTPNAPGWPELVKQIPYTLQERIVTIPESVKVDAIRKICEEE